MPVLSLPPGFNEDELYVDLRSIFGQSLFLKCEGFNFAGLIKLKAVIDTATVIGHLAGHPAAEAAGVTPTVPRPVDAAKGTNR